MKTSFKNFGLMDFMALAFLIFMAFCAIIPGIIRPFDPLAIHPGQTLSPPTGNFLLGTDEFGRDILSRIITGARPTLSVGVGSALLSLLIGVPLGVMAGFYGGLVDSFISRLLDAVLSFPPLLLTILVTATFRGGVIGLILAIGVTNFPRFARITRANVLSIRESDFVEAARALGSSDFRILTRALLPNCLSPIIVQFTLLTAIAILIESGMSFLGFGIQPPTPAWGSMLKSAQLYLSDSPWYAYAPGLTIVIVVLSMNHLGDLLRDISGK